MLNGLFRLLRRDQRGITGLETAIILIAFVVVAAVFAYTVLSAGLFATQKSQEAIYSGLEEARSTLKLNGGIIATANTTGSSGKVQQITFVVSNVAGGEPIDLTAPTANTSGNNGLVNAGSNNKVIVKYVDAHQAVSDLFWTVTRLGNSDSDYLLEQDEKFEITIGSATVGSGGGNLVDALTNTDLTVNTKFNIELITPVGAILSIERTTPSNIDAIMNLR